MKKLVFFTSTILIILISHPTSIFCEVTPENDGQQYNFVKLVGDTVKRVWTKNNVKNFYGEDNETLVNYINEFSDKPLKYLLLEYFKIVTSTKCYKDFKYVLKNIRSDPMAMKMFDAYSKPETGILNGNVKWLGEYKECLDIYVSGQQYSEIGDFHGKYCNLQFSLPVYNAPMTFTLGICIPDTCNPPKDFSSNFEFPANISEKIANFTEKFDGIVNSTHITCQATSRTLTPGAISVICLISIFGFLAVVGSSITVYEKYLESNKKVSVDDAGDIPKKIVVNDDGDEVLLISAADKRALPPFIAKVKPFFNCFCFLTNGEKLLNVSNTEGQLPSLHGIRFFSMCWVILCHSYAFSFTEMRFPYDLLDQVDGLSFQVVLNGFFSVDSFFLLSGFLMAYLFFKQAAKTDGKVPWAYFYVHRYLRLTPVYMIVLAFYTTIYPYLGSGPTWMTVDTEPFCQKNWWWNLLYINNFQPSTEQCMSWAWYLANDMQFFVISPLFLITLWRWPKIGASILGLFFCGTFLANVLITYHFGLFAGLGNVKSEVVKDMQGFLLRWQDYFDKLYVRPYARVGPYLVGLALAFILYKWQQKSYGKIKPWMLFLGWITSATVSLASIFGLYHQELSVGAASMYNGLSRSSYGLGLAWVIFVCVNGQGGPVNTFLSWKVWQPLSRLTFCAYLVHPIVQMTYLNSLKSLVAFSHITIVMFFLGVLVIGYGVAFVTSLLFESPVIRLEKFVRSKFV